MVFGKYELNGKLLFSSCGGAPARGCSTCANNLMRKAEIGKLLFSSCGGVTTETLNQIRTQKAEQRGRFNKKLLLISVAEEK